MLAATLALSLGLIPCRPTAAQELATKDADNAITSSVTQLVDQLRRHPPQPSKVAERVAGLYMIEISTGEVTLIADEPDAGITYCGSPDWSSDGKRIAFDAMRPEEVQLAHIKVIEVANGELKMTDLGIGNCPTFAPAGDRIAFFLNPGAVPNVEFGIWSMNADGTRHTRIGSWGRPKWSPDGHRFMLINFAIPATVTFMDKNGENPTTLQIPDLKVYTIPSWVNDNTIVTAVGSELGDTIALIDVSEPAHAKLKETLWKANFKGEGLDVLPTYPAYLPATGRCVFIGGGPEKVLYTFRRGQARNTKRLEPAGSDKLLQDMALSPDGRFALFTSNRAGLRQRGSSPAAKPKK